MTEQLTRRSFLAAGATTAAAAAVGLRAGPSFAETVPNLDLLKGSGNVVACSWGGRGQEAMEEAWFRPFQELTGINVTGTSAPDMAKLKVMAQVGNVEWDLIDTEGTQMLLAMKSDLLQKIDYDLIFKIVPKEDLDPNVMTEYGIGSVAFSTVLAWNTEANKVGPKDWAEFFDTDKFKGRRALYAQPKPTLEIAMMATGVPKDKVYEMDVDTAFAALDKIGPKVDLWVEKTSQWNVLMQNREIDLMGSSLGRTAQNKKAGLPYDFTFNQSIIEQSYWTIPKNAPGAANAQKLLAFIMMKKGQLKIINEFPYGMPNVTVYDDMSKEVAAMLPSSPQNAKLNLRINAQWWSDNADAVQTRWLDWMSKR
jgi:putative spermidine/putrescine transport system substrate-binding protein